MRGLVWLWVCVCVGAATGIELTLLHINDFHARFEETSVYSGRCTPGDKERNRCYGGFARLRTAVAVQREKNPNVLYLAAGDYYQGTLWYTVHKWPALAHFLNLDPPDAMALGNHEFDDGLEGLVPFLNNVSFPVLASNLVDDDEPSIHGRYARSAMFIRGGIKVAVVGYLTTETLTISYPGRLGVTDEVEAVRAEARRVRAAGAQLVVALGHAGFMKDLAIAQQVTEVDVVVGGHTNTFLYNGEDPSTEPRVGDYPTVVRQEDGKQVPVVQAYAFGKYLGRLVLQLDSAGRVTGWHGNPILLDNTVPQDEAVLRELDPWRDELQQMVELEIGRTFVFLDGARLSCRLQECNMGNLWADAVVHVNAKYPDDERWAHTSLAVINGGGIRASIDERASNGSISMEDVLTVAPFQNTIDIVELRGRHVREMFEHSVHQYDPLGLDPPGGFLQVSGFVVVYDINLPPGQRVVRLQARCQKCRVPTLQDIDDDQVYSIAMPSFVANGGDGYAVIRDNKINHHLTGLLDTDAYVEYIKDTSPIIQGTQNRILFIDTFDLCPGTSSTAILLPSHSTAYNTSDSTTTQQGRAAAASARPQPLVLPAALALLVVGTATNTGLWIRQL